MFQHRDKIKLVTKSKNLSQVEPSTEWEVLLFHGHQSFKQRKGIDQSKDSAAMTILPRPKQQRDGQSNRHQS